MQKGFLNVWRLTMFMLCLTRSASPSLKRQSLNSTLYKGTVFCFIIVYCYYYYYYYYYCCLILINVNYLFETKHLRQLFHFFLLLLCFTYHFGYVNGWQSYNTTKLPQGRVNEYRNSLLLSCLETACCDSIRSFLLLPVRDDPEPVYGGPRLSVYWAPLYWTWLQFIKNSTGGDRMSADRMGLYGARWLNVSLSPACLWNMADYIVLLLSNFLLLLSNYFKKNYTLRKVEFEVETPSTIHSALTGERPRMDRDVLPHPASSLHIAHFLIALLLGIKGRGHQMIHYQSEEQFDFATLIKLSFG